MRITFKTSTVFTLLACAAAGLAPAQDQSKKGGPQAVPDHIKKQFVSEDYTVSFGTAAKFDSSAELEIGDGFGHGFNLGWLHFLPGKDEVDVIRIKLDLGRQTYESKWPPDRAPVTVQHALMKPEAYAKLLADLAIVDSAKLQRVARGSASASSKDFWVHTQLTANKKTLIDLNWAGYHGSLGALDFAKPLAGVTLSREAIEKLEFKKHALTKDERAWASAKFARDWKKFKDLDSHWWVRERYIITIGVVGDATAYPTLREILAGDAKDSNVYYAINAVTRLTKKDVRTQPVEEMDVAKIRPKVLELIADGK